MHAKVTVSKQRLVLAPHNDFQASLPVVKGDRDGRHYESLDVVIMIRY